MIKPPQSAIAHLKANPHLHAHFDRKYGKGAASDHIGPIPIRFVMCPPKYLDNKIPNNEFMDPKEKIDVPRALTQYARLKRLFESFGTKVLEIPPTPGAQDATFTANIGVAIEPYIVLSKFKSPGRAVEVPPARRFFEGMGYQCIQPPFFFEGEADCKHWKDNIYFGGIGQSSDAKAFDWISKKTGAKFILLEEANPKAFHLDCNIFIIDPENVIANSTCLSPDSLSKLKKLVNVIEQPKGVETTGITNTIRVPGKPVIVSGAFNPEQKDYRVAMEWLLETYDKFKMSVVFIDTDAIDASGADASCTTFALTF